MAKNLPQVISDLKNGKGVFVGNPLFVKPDGSVVDVEDREQFPASALGKAAYDEFEGMAAPSEVDADISTHDASASAHSTQIAGAISTHNSDAAAHAILARKTETMRLLISRTIGAGENVSAITWTQDDAGNALALKEARIYIKVPSNSIAVGTIAQIWARINDVATNYLDAYNAAALSTKFAICLIKSLVSGSIIDIMMSPCLLCRINSAASDGTSATASALMSFSTNQFVTGDLTNIYLNLYNVAYFPTGTSIEIYGRTA